MTRNGLGILGAATLVAAAMLAVSGHVSFGIGSLGAGTYIGAPIPADTVRTPQMIARGDSIFHGRAGGGMCFTCHGPDAKGLKGLAPNLTDATWLHGDGSYAFIIATVEKGVPNPKEAFAPMLPKGGAKLSAEQVHSVSAYVYALSHPR